MFTPTELEKMVIFDIETVGNVPSFEKLSGPMKELWSDRAEILRNQLSFKYPDNKDKDNSDLYLAKAALQAEFGRIVCVSMGKIKFIDGEPTAQLVSYTDNGTYDESLILKSVFDIFTKLSRAGNRLAGHNIKRFDCPYLCKRGYINNIELPILLQIHDKKPWEVTTVDTSELWSFGAWQEGFTSLNLLVNVLGIPSPKDDINGSEVHDLYWSNTPDRISRISTYCEKDVIATIRVLLKLSNLPDLPDTSIYKK